MQPQHEPAEGHEQYARQSHSSVRFGQPAHLFVVPLLDCENDDQTADRQDKAVPHGRVKTVISQDYDRHLRVSEDGVTSAQREIIARRASGLNRNYAASPNKSPNVQIRSVSLARMAGVQ